MQNFCTLQGTNSSTFTRPPLEGPLFVSEIFDHHALHSPNHPMFMYEEAGSIHTIPWSEGVRAVHRAARLIQSALLATATDRKSVVIAILGNAGTLDMSITVPALTELTIHSRLIHVLSPSSRNHLYWMPSLSNLHAKLARRCREFAAEDAVEISVG